MQKYSKFIEELGEFIDDLRITCSICSTQVFDWCLIQYKKNCIFFKNSLIQLSSMSKLGHETDCHRFDEYKHKRSMWNHLGTATKLKVPRKTFLGPLIETSSRGSNNSQEFDIDNLFYF